MTEEEVEAEFVPDASDICTWSDDPDEKRRAFIINTYATSEIDGNILITNMELIFQWLKNATVPKETRPQIKVVRS